MHDDWPNRPGAPRPFLGYLASYPPASGFADPMLLHPTPAEAGDPDKVLVLPASAEAIGATIAGASLLSGVQGETVRQVVLAILDLAQTESRRPRRHAQR